MHISRAEDGDTITLRIQITKDKRQEFVDVVQTAYDHRSRLTPFAAELVRRLLHVLKGG